MEIVPGMAKRLRSKRSLLMVPDETKGCGWLDVVISRAGPDILTPPAHAADGDHLLSSAESSVGTRPGDCTSTGSVLGVALRIGKIQRATMLISSASPPACARIQSMTACWSVR
jgi:hypothetical protein